uniref:Uncharacterized protein n=2 Tax=Janibacter limosus TaxID=53458 RepID=A0AC61U2F6_9MICO|nr:hypothetical protein [Janibacter limosus]
MSPGTIARIARDNPGAVMLKHEDWPGLEKITALRDLEAKGEMPRLSVLTGNGGLFLDYEMERGADGAMTGYCFPDLLVDVVRMSRAGEREAAHDLFDAHLPLMRYEQQPGRRSRGAQVRHAPAWDPRLRRAALALARPHVDRSRRGRPPAAAARAARRARRVLSRWRAPTASTRACAAGSSPASTHRAAACPRSP